MPVALVACWEITRLRRLKAVGLHTVVLWRSVLPVLSLHCRQLRSVQHAGFGVGVMCLCALHLRVFWRQVSVAATTTIQVNTAISSSHSNTNLLRLDAGTTLTVSTDISIQGSCFMSGAAGVNNADDVFADQGVDMDADSDTDGTGTFTIASGKVKEPLVCHLKCESVLVLWSLV